MNISITDLLKIQNANIIDIRPRENYNNNHIPNAKNIESKELILRPENYINKNTKYYIYCQHGITSQKICKILNNKGYNVNSIIGGYESWILQK